MLWTFLQAKQTIMMIIINNVRYRIGHVVRINLHKLWKSVGCFVPLIAKVRDLTVVRASPKLINKLSSEMFDVAAGHVVQGHVLVADLLPGGQVRLITVGDASPPRHIWLNKYDVPRKQVRVSSSNSITPTCRRQVVCCRVDVQKIPKTSNRQIETICLFDVFRICFCH